VWLLLNLIHSLHLSRWWYRYLLLPAFDFQFCSQPEVRQVPLKDMPFSSFHPFVWFSFLVLNRLWYSTAQASSVILTGPQ